MYVNGWYARLFAALLLVGMGCQQRPGSAEGAGESSPGAAPDASSEAQVLRAGFLGLEEVYNSELMGPYDVLQHTAHHDSSRYIEPFIVAPEGEPFSTAEGITVTPHYSFDDAPSFDILVIPSTTNSLSSDLENEPLIRWLEQTAAQADYVVSVCSGAFLLAETGVLDGRQATTYPASQDHLAEQYPEVEVEHDVRLVVDDKFITSVGGAMSYEPGFYLVEALYSHDKAQDIANELVWDWDLDEVPHIIAGS